MKNRLRLGLWVACVSLIPFSLQASTFTIINADSAGVGFNDSTPVAPVGGNSGTTLGQQRLNVFAAAAAQWGSVLAGSVTIRVSAQWSPLNCTETSAVLGSAGAASLFRDFPNAPVSEHWYPKALADQLAGIDLAPNLADINADFNVNLGQPGCLTGVFFYLGLDNNHGGNVDLYTVLMHELAHGLGFQTYTDGSSGAFLSGNPSIWDDFIFDNTTNKSWTQMTAHQRATSAVNSSHLVWNGVNVTAAVPQVLQSNGAGGFVGADMLNRAQLYAPGTFQAGSSVAHYDTALSPNQIMEPFITSNLVHQVTPPIDLTFPLLKDIGWLDVPKKRRGQITSQD